MKFKKAFALLPVLLLSLWLAGCSAEPSVIGAVPPDESIEISIAVCGDVMAHGPQLRAAQTADGGYDFNENYDYVRGIMSGADICMANVECTFPGGDYAGYPAFRTPDSLAEALANAGVDVGLFANNHMNDSGLKGALRTCEVLESAGLKVAGCRKDTAANRSLVYQLVKEGKVINVGIVAYSYETSRSDSPRTMNGGPMYSEAVNHYNTFRQYADRSYLDRDIDNIKAEIAWCKQRCDITIVYLHWGEEYQRHSNSTQQYIASRLAEGDAPDAIIASHPHVLQEIAELGGEGGFAVPVYYSIGNYISNQRRETLDNHYTEQGLIAMVDITLTRSAVDDGKYVLSGNDVLGTPEEVEAEEAYNKKLIKLFAKKPEKAPLLWDSWSSWTKSYQSSKACPTWVNRYSDDSKTKYKIVPLVDGFENNESLVKSGNVSRASSALADIRELIGENYIWNLK